MSKLIFILEDNDDLRELYGIILAEEDYDIKAFSTIREFLDHSDEIPELYLLDVMLPDGDGMELCKLLKKNEKTAEVPVIMISAHTHLADVKSICPEASFISKPFDIDYFTHQISRSLSD